MLLMRSMAERARDRGAARETVQKITRIPVLSSELFENSEELVEVGVFLRLLSRSRFSCGFVSLGLGGCL